MLESFTGLCVSMVTCEQLTDSLTSLLPTGEKVVTSSYSTLLCRLQTTSQTTLKYRVRKKSVVLRRTNKFMSVYLCDIHNKWYRCFVTLPKTSSTCRNHIYKGCPDTTLTSVISTRRVTFTCVPQTVTTSERILGRQYMFGRNVSFPY